MLWEVGKHVGSVLLGGERVQYNASGLINLPHKDLVEAIKQKIKEDD